MAASTLAVCQVARRAQAYATEGTDGVKLSGVRAGGPADKAGLQGGDIIVEFATVVK